LYNEFNKELEKVMKDMLENYKILINTTKKHYLTGETALAIPEAREDENVIAGLQKFETFFLSEKAKAGKINYIIAGKNLTDTYEYFQDEGVRECSEIIKARIVALEGNIKIYAASMVRAILDMVIHNIKEDNIPSHIDLQDYDLDDNHLDQIKNKLKKVSHKLTKKELLKLEVWLGRNYE
jgi:hypothetical protein